MELSHTRGRAPAPSIPGVMRRTMSTWLLMAFGASLVLSALFPSRVTAAPWSLAQSLNQLLMVYGQFSDLAASAPYATQGVGGFVFFNSPQACSGPVIQSGIAALKADATAAGQVVPWMSTDEEGGTVQRLACVIGSLPSARLMAAEWTTSQVQANLAAHGAAMGSLGVTMDLAPVMDTSPANWPYNDESDRSFSDNYSTVTAYGLAFANGLQSSGIVPVAKHFPGLGHAVGNTDQGPATDPPLATLQGDDLLPFGQAINAGLPVVMVGHPSVPGLTGMAKAPGIPGFEKPRDRPNRRSRVRWISLISATGRLPKRGSASTMSMLPSRSTARCWCGSPCSTIRASRDFARPHTFSRSSIGSRLAQFAEELINLLKSKSCSTGNS